MGGKARSGSEQGELASRVTTREGKQQGFRTTRERQSWKLVASRKCRRQRERKQKASGLGGNVPSSEPKFIGAGHAFMREPKLNRTAREKGQVNQTAREKGQVR